MTPELKAILATLRTEFQSALPERFTELRNALLAAQQQADSVPLRAEARELAHKLRGTAGSYGFPRVTQAMAVIEDILRLYPAQTPPSPNEWDTLWHAMQEAEIAGAEAPPG